MNIIPGAINTAAQNETPLENAEQHVEEGRGPETMSGTIKTINPKRRQCTISENIQNLLCTQLRAELSNYNLYNTFALYFEHVGLWKMATYWRARSEEENMHHTWIRNYLAACDAKIEYPDVPITKVDITDRVTPFADTVDREIETTSGINRIMNEAMKESDWATVAFLMGDSDEEGKLIREQVEEEKISRAALHIVQQDTDWLNKQDAVYEMYFNLRPNSGD